MRLGSRHVKTWLFKSSASLCRVTSPDQYFRLALAVARFQQPRHSLHGASPWARQDRCRRRTPAGPATTSIGAAALAKRSIMLSSIAAVKTIAAGPFVPPRRNANRRYQTACDTLAALGGTLRGFHRHAVPTGPSHRRHGRASGGA